MSSSRRREEMEVGGGELAERARSMLPFWLMNCNRSFGVNAGPSPDLGKLESLTNARDHVPLDFGGSRRIWSKARSPCWNKASLSFFGESKVTL